jgi:PAS domain S-box-containing protein
LLIATFVIGFARFSGENAIRVFAQEPPLSSAWRWTNFGQDVALGSGPATQVPRPLYQRAEVLAPTGLLVVGLLAIGLALWRSHRRSQRERALAEARLRASEERFSTLFWASPLPLLIAAEADGRIVQVNQAAEMLAGLGAAAFAGHPAFAVAAAFGSTGEPAREPVTSREVEFITPDGRELALLLHTSRLCLDDAPCLLTAITDITGLRRLEESLLSAQRLEAIGQISGGVAHEFNNLLTVMQGHTDALASTLAPMTDGVQRHVDALGRSVARAAQITSGLLTFAKRQPTAGLVTDLNAALIELHSMIEGLVGRTISFKQDLDPAVPLIALAPAQIAQLVVNLSLNARDAMPEGGSLTVATRLVDGSGLDDSELLASNTGPWVSLVVRDDGCGMTEEVRRHVFEPFFSTKPSRQAMGLGLSICYGVVEHAGGRIDVESSPGRGTEVRILLPAATPSEQGAFMPQPLQLGTQGQVVLLVEDEVDVREIVAEVLEQAGYTVQACPSLQAVEALLAQDHMAPDLLLTDLVLPEGSGLTVAAIVTQRYPGLPVLFMSGYSESVYSGVDSVAHLLPKPFTSPTLLRRVRELLETDPE